MPSWCERQARRHGRNLLLLNLPLALAALAGLGDILYGIVAQGVPWGALWPALLMVALAAWTGWNCRRGWRIMHDPAQSRLWATVANFGDPVQLSEQIEADLAGEVQKFGRFRLTRHWIIRRGRLSGWAAPLAQAAWIYFTVTQNRVNGMRTSKSYGVAIHTRNGAYTSVGLSRRRSGVLMKELQARVPGAVFGFSEALKTQWHKDRRAFLAAADSRARESAARPPAASTTA